MAFGIWAAVCMLFFILAVRTYRSKKPVYFWANDSAPLDVSDVSAWNHAMARLFFTYGVLLLICGLPLLTESKVMLIFTMLGTVFSTIGMMIVYTMTIEPKYRK